MKLGFLADTHDNLPMIKKAVELFNKHEVLMVLHLGDFTSPFFVRALDGLNAKFIGIFGNNDGDKLMLKSNFSQRGLDLFTPPYLLNLDGNKILMLHEPFELDALIKSGYYTVISYAHTHIPEIRKENDVLIVNPGECGGWLYGKNTVACVDLEIMKGEIYGL